MPSSDQEEWRPLGEAWPGYDVSSLGRVRRNGRVKATYAAHSGYRRVELFRDGVGYMRALHVLIGEVWLGPRPAGKTITFKNGDRSDCRVANLEYDTAHHETFSTGFGAKKAFGRMK